MVVWAILSGMAAIAGPVLPARAAAAPAAAADVVSTPPTAAMPTATTNADGVPTATTNADGVPTAATDADGVPTAATDADGVPTAATDADGTPTAAPSRSAHGAPRAVASSPADPRRLRVAVPDLTLAEPLALGVDGAGELDHRAGRQGPPTGPAPAPAHPEWFIADGAGHRVDEADLAKALRDRSLSRRIARGRRQHQVAWTATLGALGVAAAGTGTYFAGWGTLPSSNGRRDARALGVSLVTLGTASVLLGIFVPILRPPHVIDQDEAEQLCTTYNQRLPAAAAPAAAAP